MHTNIILFVNKFLYEPAAPAVVLYSFKQSALLSTLQNYSIKTFNKHNLPIHTVFYEGANQDKI